MVKSYWLRTDRESNSIDFLAKAHEFIEESLTDKWAWKWVAIALHGALYGFAICIACGTNDSSVLTKNGKLINFDDALDRCQNSSIVHDPLRLSDEESESIRKLKNMMRNGFEHYQPGSWAIEISGMPKICIDVLRVVRFLAVESQTFRHTSNHKQNQIKSYIFQSSRLLKKHPLEKQKVD